MALGRKDLCILIILIQGNGMKKYKVEVYYDQVEYYIVEAESEEEAIDKVQESDDLKPQSAHDALWEAQSAEEIVID